MANNVPITPGVGATVGSEDVGGVQYGQVKLVDATVGSTAPIGTALNPLPVTGNVNIVSALPVGNNNIGNVDLASSIPAGTNNIGDVDIASALPAGTNNIGTVNLRSADLCVSATGAAATLVTATLPAVAGQFHYITKIDVECYASAARVGAAAPTIVTTTNLPGNPSWNFPTAQVIGSIDRNPEDSPAPFRSAVANTATTIVGPATANVIWKINVFYYTAA